MDNGLLIARRGSLLLFALTAHCNAHLLYQAVNLLRLDEKALIKNKQEWMDFMECHKIGCSGDGCRGYEDNPKIVDWLNLKKAEFAYYHDVDMDAVSEE